MHTSLLLAAVVTLLAATATAVTASPRNGTAAVRVHATGDEAIRQHYHQFDHAPRLQRRDAFPPSERPLNGLGIKVGIIDSGIDYLHPALGGCFGSGCKVAFGYDFVGDDYDGYNDPVPDSDPLDECNGHGTHVAGIVAAQGSTKVGTAPRATLGAYRVFGCQGSVGIDVLVAAIRRAGTDGMDVVNISIGTSTFFNNLADTQAAQALVKQGVVVIASAGNNGDLHMSGVASPSTAPDVISVASIASLQLTAFSFTLTTHKPQPHQVIYLSSGQSKIPTSASPALQLAEARNLHGCSRFTQQLSSYKGHFIAVQRGNCPFGQKAQNAEKAGAAGVVILSTDNDIGAPVMDGYEVRIPALLISKLDGDKLLAAMGTAGRVNVRWDQTVVRQANERASFTSVFSSYGPSADAGIIKPDISAEGDRIFSTYPRKLGEFAIMTGTSMAAPHVSGLAAIALQNLNGSVPARERPLAVRRILLQNINSKHWPDWMPNAPADRSYVLPTTYTGAGVARYGALRDGLWGVHPLSIAFPGSERGGHSVTVSVTLTGSLPPGTVYFQYMPGTAVSDWQNGQLKPGRLMGQKISRGITPGSITIPKGAPNTLISRNRRETFSVTLTAPLLEDTSSFWMMSGQLKLVHTNAATGEQSVRRILYQTTLGSVKHIAPLERSIDPGYPRLDAFSFDPFELTDQAPDSFSSAKNRGIAIRFRSLMPLQRSFVVIVRDSDPNSVMGIAEGLEGDELDRSSDGEDNDYWSGWSGYVIPVSGFNRPSGKAKPIGKGRYRMKLYASRPFTDLADESMYDSWLSPSFLVEDVAPLSVDNAAAKKVGAQASLASYRPGNHTAANGGRLMRNMGHIM